MIVHVYRRLLEITGALLEMIAILRRIDWAIAALPLRIHSTPRNLFTHPHLLSIRKLILKLVLLISVSALAGTFVGGGDVGDSDCVSRLRIHSLSTCILNATLNTFMIYVGSRIQRILHIG